MPRRRLDRRWFIGACAVQGALLAGCSMPNLESQNCIEARGMVKQFYSFHFGNEMSRSPEHLRAGEKFLTKELYASVSHQTDGVDYFTKSEPPPKTFKIGKCVERDVGTADLQVQLYWREDERTDQKEVQVETVREKDTWLINRVSN